MFYANWTWNAEAVLNGQATGQSDQIGSHIYDKTWLYQRHICSSIFATFLEANNAVYACYLSQMAHNFVQSWQHNNLQMRNKDIQGRLYALTAGLWDARVTVKQTILAKLGSPVRPVRLTKLVIVVKLVKLMTSIVFKGLIEKLKVTLMQCGPVVAHSDVKSNAKSSFRSKNWKYCKRRRWKVIKMIDCSPIIIRSKEKSSKERLSISLQSSKYLQFWPTFFLLPFFILQWTEEFTPSQDRQLIRESFQSSLTWPCSWVHL